MKIKLLKILLISLLVCGFGHWNVGVLAQERSVEHTVSFDPDDGSPYISWFKIEVGEGELITELPPEPTQPGKAFIGWAHSFNFDGSPLFWNFDVDTVSHNTTLWAVYKQTHTVAFDPEDESSYESWFKIDVIEGELITELPPEPTQPGKVFVGWAHSFNLDGSPLFWNFDVDTVSHNTTLWAVYSNVYTVTFNPNNGSTADDWFKTTVVEGTKIEEQPTEPTRSGYIFMGWKLQNGSDGIWDFNIDIVNSDLTLEAVWKETSPNTSVVSQLLSYQIIIVFATATLLLIVSKKKQIEK